ncbi:MAG: hypothetical protein LCH58_12575 [Bacteroidetes bacterium]|uniref:hypothetical protein n=1 Tax=Phnomibacter sp. TaxID=2836217 RepID=UPI002FDD9203|nr:hypothetical protein [Bacteroidota bacterium]
MNMLTKDNFKLGLILGFFLPFAGVVIYYYWKIYPNEFSTFLEYLTSEKRLLSSLTVVCLLLNVGLFTAYINTHRDKTAKGVFAISVVYAVVSLMIKFFA